MSKSRTETTTRTTPTVYGDIEYETVECGSCGTEIAKEDAQRFVVGDLKSRTTLQNIDKDKFEFSAETVATGWACEFCYEEGVVGFPEKTVSRIMRGRDPQTTTLIVFIMFELLLLGLVFVVSAIGVV